MDCDTDFLEMLQIGNDLSLDLCDDEENLILSQIANLLKIGRHLESTRNPYHKKEKMDEEFKLGVSNSACTLYYMYTPASSGMAKSLEIF